MPLCLALKKLTLIKGETGAKEMQGAEVEGRAGKAARQNVSGNTHQGCSPFLGNKISHKVTPCPSVPDRKQTLDSLFSYLTLCILLMLCMYVFWGMFFNCLNKSSQEQILNQKLKRDIKNEIVFLN